MSTGTDTQTEAEKNPLELSDDEFLNMSAPPSDVVDAPVEPSGSSEEVASDTPTEGAAEVSGEDTQTASEGGSTEASTEAAASGQDTVQGAAGADTVSGGETGSDTVAQPGNDTIAGGDSNDAVSTEQKSPDYEAFYKQVMGPLKANGKTIEIRSPEEAIGLMQMGANYTRKMQEIAPHRKVLAMLKNNDLLNEDRLSFLIDLDKKNPEAIKKLIKDSGIDPMEIDTSSEPAYLGGSHRVTDEEVNFQSALDELVSAPNGKETLQDINTRWDDTSKAVLMKHPEVFATIHAQREVGIYDRIAAEVDRRKTIGSLPQGMSFLEAYNQVGHEMTEAKAFEDLREKHSSDTVADAPSAPAGQPGSEAKPTPVTTRVAAPKPDVDNDAAAKAASPTRIAPKPVKEVVNVLAMSDDDFIKQFEGRL